MLLRETLRTVVTEVELGKVAVVIAVSQSACQAHVTRGQRELQAAGVGIALLAGGEYQQGTQGVNVKVLVPVQAAFPVHGVGHVLLSFFIGQIVCTILIDTVNMVLACVRVVAAQLIPVESGGTVVDTPGFSAADLENIDKQLLGSYFPEFRKFIPDCYYNTCTHSHEPDCAVKKALEDGHIAQSRYDGYINILNTINERKKAY